MRKALKWFLAVVVLALIILSGSQYLRYRDFMNQDLPLRTVRIDDMEISYDKLSVKSSLFWGLWPVEKEAVIQRESPAVLETDSILHQLEVSGDFASLSMRDEQDQINTLEFSKQAEIELKQNGQYHFTVVEDDGQNRYEYNFDLKLKQQPVINISNTNPAQGEVILVKISNLFKDSEIKIKSHFRPSALFQSDHEAHFFLPMAYRDNAGNYPLTIEIDGVNYETDLSVQSYAFTELHFTVESSTVSSTVGNNDAVKQFRDTIYPLYETYDPDDYRDGLFILPVEGARISSGFGDKRFVNNATTPTRHVGIDYAIACGTDVVASNRGKVEYAGFLTMIGNTVVIDHGLGLKTYYEHMEDLEVKTGDMVEKGDLIGHVGTTGYSTGCHLHFQAMVLSNSINPAFLYDLE